MLKRALILAMLLMIALVPAVSAQDDEGEDMDEMGDMPDVVEFQRTGVLPEGVEWDAERGRFLVGSLSEGTIFEINDEGEIIPFIEDDALISTVGIHIDQENDRLLAAVSNRAAISGGEVEGPLVQAAAYDLETGERVYVTNLSDLLDSQQQFVNDVTNDPEGNAYMTNSFAPVIYQIRPEGEAEVFVEDEQLAASGFGLNGIVYHPDGYLLAAVTANGSLYKIPVDDPENVTQVELETSFGVDGMVLTEENALVAVARPQDTEGQQIVYVTSDDDWQSASIQAGQPTDGAATTVAIRDDAFYYVNAYLNDGERETYELVKVMFEGMMDMAEDTEAMTDHDPEATPTPAEEGPQEPAATEEAGN